MAKVCLFYIGEHPEHRPFGFCPDTGIRAVEFREQLRPAIAECIDQWCGPGGAIVVELGARPVDDAVVIEDAQALDQLFLTAMRQQPDKMR